MVFISEAKNCILCSAYAMWNVSNGKIYCWILLGLSTYLIYIDVSIPVSNNGMIIRQVRSQILCRPNLTAWTRDQQPSPRSLGVERLDNLLVRSMEGWRVDAVTRKHQLVTSPLILSSMPASASHIHLRILYIHTQVTLYNMYLECIRAKGTLMQSSMKDGRNV